MQSYLNRLFQLTISNWRFALTKSNDFFSFHISYERKISNKKSRLVDEDFLIETERLFLRELEYSDENDLFEMDSDPEVHLYIENNPVKSIDQIQKAIEMLKKQYQENGIARWAVVDKLTNECMGWSGLKYFDDPLNNHNDFY